MAERIAPSSTSDQSSLINLTSSPQHTKPFSRVTRSAARLAADTNAAAAATQVTENPPPPPQPPPASKKRKAAQREISPEAIASSSRTAPSQPVRRSKRQRIEAEEAETAPSPVTAPSRTRPKRAANPPPIMSASGSMDPSGDGTAASKAATSSKRRTGRGKKSGQDGSPSAAPKPSTRSKKVTTPKAEEAPPRIAEDPQEAMEGTSSAAGKVENDISDEGDGDVPRDYDQDEDDDGIDPFRSGFLGRPGSGPGGLSSTLRALSGMVSGVSTRLRNILENLRQKGDPSVQLIALQDLSEILLVSTEDTLAGQFAPDQYVKELVSLMKANEFEEGNPEMMLLACRCIANLMEALPQATANVVYGGAVPILCSKLLEIQFIDLAEQALSTLEKISLEFPASIVREGGLTACLTFLDFFATSTQRTAVTTAANCCRNLSEDSFPTVRDVMDILQRVLASSDQKVVEQGSLCVTRIVESFKYQPEKLEELITPDMLKAILGLLLPGTTNLIGPKIHTQFLRLLAITARASPSLSVALLKMDVIDTLYQILTGVSPPEDSVDVASKIDSVLIMQALIHRPKEQIFETLNVICELLPKISTEGLALKDQMLASGVTTEDLLAMSSAPRSEGSSDAKRVDLLKSCQPQLRRFATVLLPTLTHAYSSTVNLSVRQKVLLAQLKMISNLEIPILENALQSVPYASYLASILSQQDHPILVMFALQAAEFLLVRMEPIYRYQFYREGVIAEISKLASQPRKQHDKTIKLEPNQNETSSILRDPEVKIETDEAHVPVNVDEHVEEEDDDPEPGDPENGDEDGEEEINGARDEVSPSPSTSSSSSDHQYAVSSPEYSLQDYVIRTAKNFMDVHEKSGKGVEMREKASRILDEAQSLAKAIRSRFLGSKSGDAMTLFTQLSHYFSGNALESITSSELLNSEVVQVLLDVLECPDESTRRDAQMAFLEVFMNAQSTGQAIMSSSAFGVLVHKLQDLFSREEHFEVLTVHHNALDSNRSSAASMLAKQLRLKLVADEDSGIPRAYRHIMVSIHAIATFKALDDYLRPRISFGDRPRGGRHHEAGVSNALAAFAAAAGLPNAHQRLADRGLLGIGAPAPVAAPTHQPGTSTASRKPLKSKGPRSPIAPETPANLPNTAEKPPPRRSSRKTQANQSPATPVQALPPQPPPEEVEEGLECADERQLVDEDDLDGGSALDAFVDDLEDEMDNANLPDPSAVNLEVAPTGKVTARQEDGTRVPTPSQPTNPTQPPGSARHRAAQANPMTPSNLDRAMSYAAAIQSIPQDWHMEFSINNEPISNETTIYRAVHRNSTHHDEASSRNLWSGTHTIKIKKIAGPPSSESSLTPPPDLNRTPSSSGMPLSLQKHPETASILRLLDVMHKLNANLDQILGDSPRKSMVSAEPLAQFVNTKLTAKLNRQLEEPLIVASNCLPSWSEDLARLYPFLFPFETRHLFLQSTSFGYSRSMSRWQSAQSTEDSRRDRHRDERPFLGRLQRQKVRISRSRILESAVKVMELYGASPSVLEVEYFEEVGTGLGPTLEFYSTVSREFSRKKIKLWRENESTDKDEFAFGAHGLFPAPMSKQQAESENGQKLLNLFKMLGKFVARSMLDSRIIDVSFNPMFFRVGDSNNPVSPSLEALRTVDGNLASSLKLLKQFADLGTQLRTRTRGRSSGDLAKINGVSIDDLALDFTLPGYPHVELVENGANIPLTLDNVGDYIDKVLDLTLAGGVQRQVDAFRAGFSQVFPYTALSAFTPSELVMLFGRVEEDWALETLMDSIKADHGFNMDSKSVKNLLAVMSELKPPQRRDFLQFATGSPKLPIGGFKSLTPMFTVVCKPSEPPYTSDDYLPSVMTCVNYLKLPDYTDLATMRKRLYTAIREGQGAFHLS